MMDHEFCAWIESLPTEEHEEMIALLDELGQLKEYRRIREAHGPSI